MVMMMTTTMMTVSRSCLRPMIGKPLHYHHRHLSTRGTILSGKSGPKIVKREKSEVYFDMFKDEIASKLERDTTIYSLEKLSHYNKILIGSGAAASIIFYGGIFLCNLAAQKLRGRGDDTSAQLTNTFFTFLERNIRIIGTFLFIIPVLGFGYAKFRITKTISSIVLRAGGERVLFSHLQGLPLSKSQRNFEVPLSYVSCHSSRHAKENVIPISIKGRRFKFMIDKDGYFPDPFLFDHTIGVERKF